MSSPRRIRPEDRGSAVVEVMLATPALVLLALAAFAAYQAISAVMVADSAAHAAARSATLERTAAQAETAAASSAADITEPSTTCSTHSLNTDLQGLQPGMTVHTTVTCKVDLTPLFGVTLDVAGSGAAVVDQYRGTP